MKSVKRLMIVEVEEEIIVVAVTDRDQHVNLTVRIILQREYEISSVKTPHMEYTVIALLNTHHHSITENTKTSYDSKTFIKTRLILI